MRELADTDRWPPWKEINALRASECCVAGEEN